MRYPWNPNAITADRTFDYTVNWAESIFGKEHATEIADIVSKYPKYNLWRKPEVQDPRIFSFVNYNEADRVLQLWKDEVAKAEALQKKIAPEAKDDYYQLVLYPAKASAGVVDMYLSVGRNNLSAKQDKVSANDFAKRARDLSELDKNLAIIIDSIGNLSRSKVLKPLPPLGLDYALVSRRQPRRNEIFDNLRWLDVDLNVTSSGLHTLKVFMIDPEIVLERIVVNPDNSHPSYFGVPSLQFNAGSTVNQPNNNVVK